MEEQAKMFMFGRWMSTYYSSDEMNSSDGYWWKEQLTHFNEKVYPNLVKNGSVENTIRFLEVGDILKDAINDLP